MQSFYPVSLDWYQFLQFGFFFQDESCAFPEHFYECEKVPSDLEQYILLIAIKMQLLLFVRE